MSILYFILLSPYFLFANDWPDSLQAQVDLSRCQEAYQFGQQLSVPLDGQVGGESFSLFYFTAKSFNAKLPTVLYIDGGPGQGPGMGVNTLRFKGVEDINVVYFHPRGVGCSPLPVSSSYDQYIRTHYLVSDIEAIRVHLGLINWDLVFATSYGSLVAAQYAAHNDGKHAPRIIMEGWHLPEHNVDNQDALVIGTGFTNAIEVLAQWPEYQTPEIQNIQKHIEQDFDLFVESGGADGLKTVLQQPIGGEQIEALLSSLKALSAVGPKHQGAFSRVSAFGALNQILRIYNDGRRVSLPRPIFTPENSFPLSSNRVFFVTSFFEGIDPQFAGLVSDFGDAIFAPGQQASFLSPFLTGKNLAKVVYPSTNLSKSAVKFYVLQGGRDLITPAAAVDHYLADIEKAPKNIEYYKLDGYGHSRHFDDACYQRLFEHIITDKSEPLVPLSLCGLGRQHAL